jgi:hypothetical protein
MRQLCIFNDACYEANKLINKKIILDASAVRLYDLSNHQETVAAQA